MTQKENAEQTRLYDGSIANAKELEALQHEIANLKKRRSESRGRTPRADGATRGARCRRRRSAGHVRTSSVRRSNGWRRSLGEELADRHRRPREQRTAERAAIAAEIDPETLELYEDLRRLKKGIGAAALVDGVCQGCHEQLSAVQLDKLKKTDGIRRCEHCRRILVF